MTPTHPTIIILTLNTMKDLILNNKILRKKAQNDRAYRKLFYANGALLRGSISGSIRPIFSFSKSSGLRQAIQIPIKK